MKQAKQERQELIESIAQRDATIQRKDAEIAKVDLPFARPYIMSLHESYFFKMFKLSYFFTMFKLCIII
jgi:hypothetical protein